MLRPANNVEVQDEGVSQGFVRALNFAGAGVSAAVSGSTGTVTIAGGGGGGASATEVEVDFGATPAWDALFTVTDAAVSGTSKIMIAESGKVATGRVLGDSQWDSISCAANPGAGSFSVYALAHPGPVVGKRTLIYTVA